MEARAGTLRMVVPDGIGLLDTACVRAFSCGTTRMFSNE